MFVWLVLIWDIVRGEEVYGPPQTKAEPISAGREGAIFGGIVLSYADIIIIFNILCVGCVGTRLG